MKLCGLSLLDHKLPDAIIPVFGTTIIWGPPLVVLALTGLYRGDHPGRYLVNRSSPAGAILVRLLGEWK